MNYQNAILVLLLTFSLDSAFAKGDPIDSRETDAAIEILTVKKDIEFNYQFCRGKAGSYGYKYDYLSYIWELKNKIFLQSSEKMFGNLPASKANQIRQGWEARKVKMLSERKNADGNENGKYCSQYFSRILDETTDKLRSPKQDLTPKLGSSEVVRIAQRDIDMEVGCMKQGYNRDVKEFGFVKKACSCTISLTLRRMSNREVDEYLTLASSKNPQDAMQFVNKRISNAELQACFK